MEEYDNGGFIFFNYWTDWNLISFQFSHNRFCKATFISFLCWHLQFNWEAL